MYVCMYVCMHVCIYVCMYVCMYACMYVWMYVYKRIVRWDLTGRIKWKDYFAIGSFGWPAVARLARPRWRPSGGSARPRRSETIGNRKVWRFRPGAISFEHLAPFRAFGFLQFFDPPEFSKSIFELGRGCQSSLYISVWAFLGFRSPFWSAFLGGPRGAFFRPFLGLGRAFFENYKSPQVL